MIITEEQFFDYMECPAKYELKHIKKIDIPKTKSIPSLIRPIGGFFFTSIFGGKVPSIDSLKNKWDKVCIENQDYIDPKKNIEGIGLLVNLHRYASDNQIVVLDYGTAYSIDTHKENKLVGNISNPIISAPNNEVEMLVPYYGNKIPKTTEIDTKLKYTIDNIGFEQSYSKRPLGTRIVLLKKYEEFYTTRDYVDQQRLYYAIDGVCKGIYYESFYPRESVFCNTCTANSVCKYWTGS